jgi:plastocyanin
VRPGETVTWRNDSPNTHTITSGLGIGDNTFGNEFDQELAPGGTFTVTFPQSGLHPYFCRWFEAQGMTAVVLVTR